MHSKCSHHILVAVLQAKIWLNDQHLGVTHWSHQSFPCCRHVSDCTCVVTQYTGCNRRNGPDFRRVFLRSNYTDITQNTYIQSWTVTEILAREKSGLLWCLRAVFVSVTSFSPLLELHSYVRANVAPATRQWGEPLAAYSGWKSMDNYDMSASVFVVLFNGFMSLTSYFDVMYRY